MHLLVLQSVAIHETVSEVPATSAHGCVSLETWPPPFPAPSDAAEGLVAGGPSLLSRSQVSLLASVVSVLEGHGTSLVLPKSFCAELLRVSLGQGKSAGSCWSQYGGA